MRAQERCCKAGWAREVIGEMAGEMVGGRGEVREGRRMGEMKGLEVVVRVGEYRVGVGVWYLRPSQPGHFSKRVDDLVTCWPYQSCWNIWGPPLEV